jgi:amidase
VSRLEADYGRSKVRGSLEEVTMLLAQLGRALPAETVAASHLTARRVGAALSRYFERYDLLLTPTLGRVPVPLEQTEPTLSEQRLLRFLVSPAAAGLFRVARLRERVLDTQLQALAHRVRPRTMVANLTGIPAMSVPMHRTENALPVGVQLLAPYGAEAMLLKLASQLEKANPWRVRH